MKKSKIKFKAIINGAIEEYYVSKGTKDGSQVIIPKKNNTNGKHITAHPSGIVNASSNEKYIYDLFKNPELKKHIENRISNLEEIKNPQYAIVFDLREIEKYMKRTHNEITFDYDGFVENCEWYEFEEGDNFDFIEKYKEPFFDILIVDKDGNNFFAAKNKPGFGLLRQNK